MAKYYQAVNLYANTKFIALNLNAKYNYFEHNSHSILIIMIFAKVVTKLCK